MGARSRARRARRAWIYPLVIPLLAAARRYVQGLRPRSAWRLGRDAGALFDLLGVRRPLLRRNLRIACGREPDALPRRRFERAFYRHLGLLIVEWLRQPLVTRENLRRHVEPASLDAMRGAYDEGRGVIYVAGHAGLWELAGHVTGLLGVPVLSSAKMSGHEDLDRFVLEVREAGGQRVREARGSLWPMKKALDRREAVGINVDQEARTNNAFTPFFGAQAATSATPAQLHLRTGAPIVCVTAVRRGPFRYALEIVDVIRHPPSGDREADVHAITARINAATERLIRAHPEQWLWIHRRWRRRPPHEAADGSLPRRDPAAPPLDLDRATLW